VTPPNPEGLIRTPHPSKTLGSLTGPAPWANPRAASSSTLRPGRAGTPRRPARWPARGVNGCGEHVAQVPLTVRGLRNSRAPSSGFDSPSPGSRAICRSCAVRLSRVSAVRLRTFSPDARRSLRARSANASIPIARNISWAVRSCSRASGLRFVRRNPRRRAAAREQAPGGVGCGRAARSPRDRARRLPRHRSPAPGNEPGLRAPNRCRRSRGGSDVLEGDACDLRVPDLVAASSASVAAQAATSSSSGLWVLACCAAASASL
jgi:hypothetical protein